MSEWREDARRDGWGLDALSIWARDERADESTPIFWAMASDWECRERRIADDRNALGTTHHHGRLAAVPEPRSERGSSRDQRSQDNRRSPDLASVDTMSPPPARANTPEDELDHRPKHRREAAGGRHAVQLREKDTGYHVCKVVRLVPRT